ncbi:unnamed protein product [Clonostachys rhizophaga]|uniref:Uncharacterized protein n=1 Tax=Clonostachys rhizophaga TaxID=160324 RepID=A0A9N9YQM7_9HYPO|nr:unnamed protein product [Clonostachys rhizophaga]
MANAVGRQQPVRGQTGWLPVPHLTTITDGCCEGWTSKQPRQYSDEVALVKSVFPGVTRDK